MVGETCPEPDALQRLALNQAAPAEALRLSKHLVRCVMCAEMVKALRDASQVLAALPGMGTSSRAAEASGPAGVELRETLPHPPPEASPPRTAPAAAPEFLAPPQAPDEIGRLGPYRVLKILGSGGMGVVFQAEDVQLRRRVALKAMRPHLIADDTCRHRFLQEARAAAALDHDHIVTVYQVGEDRGVPYLAMQYLQGENLEDRLWREKRLSTRETLRIGREMAEGLFAAHERGLIHRDIKPSNIWLEAGRGAASQPAVRGGRVKILDFGLARRADDDGKNITQTGFVVGTAGYIAPEQARGLPVDARCDLFSLGCVLYEMSTGTVPFQGADAMSRLTALAVEQPRSPRQLNPNLPPKLSQLILGLLNKAPDDRPRSAQMVVEELSAIEHDLTLQPATPDRLPSRIPQHTLPVTPPSTSSNSTRQLLVIGFLLALLGAVAYKILALMFGAAS